MRFSCYRFLGLARTLPLVIAALGFTSSVATADMVRTVAITGAQAPGAGTGAIFSTSFGVPAFNNSGQTAFTANLTGAGANDFGIWSEGSGSLQLASREGDQAPGTDPGVTYRSYNSNLSINDNGRVAFQAGLTGPGVSSSNRDGVWSDGSGSLQIVAREGDQPPGIGPGITYIGFNPPKFNNSGQVAFEATLGGTGIDSSNRSGVWSQGSGTLQKVARQSEPAPGTGAGVNYGSLTNSAINESGQVAFQASLAGTGVDSFNNSAIYSDVSGSVQKVARGGDPAPGLDPGVNFRAVFAPRLNSGGQTVFPASLTGTSVDSTNDFSLWRETNGNLQMIARKGEQAPGTNSGVNYGNLFSVEINSNSQTVFRGNLSGPGVTGANNLGIWSESNGNIQLVARTGDEAPGTGPGVDFLSLFGQNLNDSGQVAFTGTLTGAGVNSSNDRGIWATNLLGNLSLIAREGDQLDVDDGPLIDLRTISTLGFFGGTGNGDGRASGFNDSGQLAFRASFTDGTSGIFVSNVVAVPEASAVLVWSALSVCVLARRRRNESTC